MISVRIVFLPVPGISTHIFDGAFCFEVEFFFSEVDIGVAGCNVTRSSRIDNIREFFSTGFFKGVEHFKNGDSLSGSEIVDVDTWFGAVF